MPEETVDVAALLKSIREDVQQQRLSAKHEMASLVETLERLEALKLLPLAPTAGDIPTLGRVSQWPGIGQVLAVAREFYQAVWIFTHKRTPWLQQMRYNLEVTEAIRELTQRLDALQAQQNQLARDVALLKDRLAGVEVQPDPSPAPSPRSSG